MAYKLIDRVVSTAMKTLGISKEQAVARVGIVSASGLEKYTDGPDDPFYQMMVENFMRFDPHKIDYQKMLFDTLNFPQFVKEYDKKYKTNLAKAVKDLNSDKSDFALIKKEIESFDKFFYYNIWIKYPKQN